MFAIEFVTYKIHTILIQYSHFLLARITIREDDVDISDSDDDDESEYKGYVYMHTHKYMLL